MKKIRIEKMGQSEDLVITIPHICGKPQKGIILNKWENGVVNGYIVQGKLISIAKNLLKETVIDFKIPHCKYCKEIVITGEIAYIGVYDD